MLRKKTPLTILFLLLFPSFQIEADFNSYKVRSIINADKWQLYNGQIFIFNDLEMVDFTNENLETNCFKEQVKYFVNQNIKNQTVFIEVEKKHKRVRNRPFYIYGNIKLKKGRTDLKKFFIEQGWAKYLGNEKKKLLLQSQAMKSKLGVWGSCYIYNELNKAKLILDRQNSIISKGTGVTWIKDVIDENRLLAHDDTIINIATASSINTSKVELDRCLNSKRIEWLNKNIKGRKVILEPDVTESLERKTIVRHVWRVLPNRNSLVSNEFISMGLMFFDKNTLDKKYNRAFRVSGNSTFRTLPSAWKECLDSIVHKETVMKKVKDYDEDCRIKGNISGSKKNPVKTYHTPLSGWYKRIEYEKCFESEEAAIKAGFIKTK